jgi:NAD(P)H-hydrate epimerase
LYHGAEYTGQLFIEDIGFPGELLQSETLTIRLLIKENIKKLIPERKRYSHKGNYGHILIVAGSKGKTGAALMAAKACLRAGAGLVTIGIPESVAGIIQSRITEEMTLILPDKGNGTLSEKASKSILDFLDRTADVLAIGPGIGVNANTEKIMRDIMMNSSVPLLIDADGINSLSFSKKLLSEVKVPVILTPHPGEMARLLSEKSKVKNQKTVAAKDIEKDRIDIATSFAKQTKTYLVLKGVPTIVADPEGKGFINSTGNPGMSTAGSGDVLTGMIAGFLGQNKNPLNACLIGVYIHGLAGDIAASEKGEISLIATDIIDKIPNALISLESNE